MALHSLKAPNSLSKESSNSVAFRAFAPYHFLHALSLRPGVPYEGGGSFVKERWKKTLLSCEGWLSSSPAGLGRYHGGFSFLSLERKKRNKESSRADTSFAKNGIPLTEGPELAFFESSNSVAFRAFAPYHFLYALSLRPGVSYEVAGVFQVSVRRGSLYLLVLLYNKVLRKGSVLFRGRKQLVADRKGCEC